MYAVGFGDDVVAAGGVDLGAVHGRIGQAHGKGRLDLDAQGADHLLDFGQAGGVGNAQVDVDLALDVVMGLAFQAGVLEGGLDLRPGAMHEHEFHAQAVQQGEVVGDVVEVVVGEGFTGQQDDEHLPAVGVDIG